MSWRFAAPPRESALSWVEIDASDAIGSWHEAWNVEWVWNTGPPFVVSIHTGAAKS